MNQPEAPALTRFVSEGQQVNAALSRLYVPVAPAPPRLGRQRVALQARQALRSQARRADAARRQVGARGGQRAGGAAARPVPAPQLKVGVAVGAGEAVGWVRGAAGGGVEAEAGGGVGWEQDGPREPRQRTVFVQQRGGAPAVANAVLRVRQRGHKRETGHRRGGRGWRAGFAGRVPCGGLVEEAGQRQPQRSAAAGRPQEAPGWRTRRGRCWAEAKRELGSTRAPIRPPRFPPPPPPPTTTHTCTTKR
jgi:hypothetical protein